MAHMMSNRVNRPIRGEKLCSVRIHMLRDHDGLLGANQVQVWWYFGSDYQLFNLWTGTSSYIKTNKLISIWWVCHIAYIIWHTDKLYGFMMNCSDMQSTVCTDAQRKNATTVEYLWMKLIMMKATASIFYWHTSWACKQLSRIYSFALMLLIT